MEKLESLIKIYSNQFMKDSLITVLSNFVFDSVEVNRNNNSQNFLQEGIIRCDGGSAKAAVKDHTKIHRYRQDIYSNLWLLIYPLQHNFSKCFYFKKEDPNQLLFKFITLENTSVSDIDFIQTLTSCLRQTIPNFGTVLSISELELPYAFIHEIYTIVYVEKDSVDIDIFGNFYQLGKIASLKFVSSENSESTISIIKSLFKKPIVEMNLDQSLWRIGLDSLKIATLEFKLKAIFDGTENFPHGFCLKLESIRQLLEITNALVLKQTKINSIFKKCDLKMPKLPITEAQKQLLFLCKTENGNDFVEEFSANSEIPLKFQKLKNALTETLEANPSLKSVFGLDYANILPTDEAVIIFTDLKEFNNYKFNVFSKPSLAFFFAGGKFAMKFHHILLDGKSLQLFVDQLMAFYHENPPNQNLNYFDFALFEYKFLESTNFSKDFDYWMTKLSVVENFPKLLKISNYFNNDYGGSIVAVDFPQSLTTNLHNFCSSNSVSLFSAFIASYRFLIYKLYGFTDFPFLISIDNRLDERFQNTIGLFVNLATVSFKLDPNENFLKLLKQAATDLTETISHSTVPYNRVISALRHQSLNEPEMPEVMLVHDQEAAFEDAEISTPLKKNFVQNPQIWYLKEIGENLKLQIEFRDSLFSSEAMENQASRFLGLMEKVLQNPKMPLKSFDFLTQTEMDQFLEFRQALSNPIPIVSPIQLIFQKLETNLHKVIIKTTSEELTSEDLMEKVVQYAEKLKCIYEARFKRLLPTYDQPVGILLQRSIDLIKLVLACWYLNLAPLMLTPDWPFDRIKTSLTGFQNLILITDNDDFVESYKESFDASISLISIKTFHTLKSNPTKSRLSMASSNPTDLAYLTFTSGSTGSPKAVQSLQRGLINLFQNYSHYFSITSKSTVYQVVNPAFDIFFADIISTFGNGSTLFLASQKIPKMDELKECTHAYIMPAYLSQLDLDNPEILKILKSLDAILYGGEPMNPNCLQKALKEGLNLFQQFGVTEHSIYSNFISPKTIEDRLVVGQSFDNFHGYLIDSDGCRLPPINLGIQGGFRSAGIAVARGYVGCEKQNQAFGEEEWFDGWRYFDSGDQMKAIPAGENDENPWNCKFIFCGRNDSQIKIRGNRVELRDVEEPFRRHSNIKEIVCLFDGIKLIAFIAFKNPILMNEKDLRDLALQNLPIYMIPETFVILETFPLNSNGKIDRQKLLSLSVETSESQNHRENASLKVKPSSADMQIICCEIFAKHLKVPSLTPGDDLFQKGADSLKLLMAVQEIDDTVGMKLDLAIIFRVRTISKTLELQCPLKSTVSLQKHHWEISDSENSNFKTSDAIYETEIHQLSHSQEHLWFLEKLNHDFSNIASDAYILKFKITHSESLSKTKWNDLIKFLITKHPILRTQIIENAGIPSQRILQVDDELVQKLSTKTDTVSPDILTEPPIKFKISEDLKTLEIGCHHIAIDGYSLNILISDIEAFFNSELPEAIIPDYKYFDFIKSQKANNFSQDLQFFQQKLSIVKNFSSRMDYPRSRGSSFQAGHYHTSLKINGFDEFLNKYQISETHFILAIFALQQFGNCFSSSEDNAISVGMPFANRSLTFVSTVGYFVNAHAIPISCPSSTQSFDHFLTKIKDIVLEILSHSSVPFELVVRQLKPKREINKSPIFQQMIIFEDLRNPKTFDNFEVTEMDSNEAKLDQTWRIKRTANDKFEIHVEFIKAFFKEETISKAVERFKILITKVLERKITKLSDIFEDEETLQMSIENLWKKILETDAIEPYANFFEEGGHSLLAARLTSMVNSKFGIKASINLLFEHQTLEEYFHAIEKLLNKNNNMQILATETKSYPTQTSQKFPVNPLQIPLLELLRKASEAGNAPLLEAYVNQIQIQCPNGIKIDKIKNALEQLLQRHTVLRTKFGYSKIDGSTVFEYFYTIQDLDYCRRYLLSTTKFSTMNIFEDTVFRASMNESNVLTLEISHLVSDGHSMNILAKDLFALFTNKPLPDLVVDYANFNQIFIDSAKQNEKEQKEFWAKMFSNKDYSNLETDFIEKGFDYSSASVSKIFANGNSCLAKAVKDYRCSPLSLLLYSFAFRFREKLRDFGAPLRMAFCKDMRPSEEFYNSIGFFVNTLIIPIETTDNIHDIEEKVQNAQKYSWITVDDARKWSTKNGDENLFNVMLVLDNSPNMASTEKLNGYKVLESKQSSTKFDLTVFVQINGKNLNIKVEYRKALWKQETINTLLDSWETDGFEEKVPKISKVLLEFNAPTTNVITVDFDKRDITVILMEVFEKYGKNIALKSEDAEVTYNQLQKRIMQISNQIQEEYFKEMGCIFGVDTVIPVISKNSIEQWLLCLGVIFAGGAYLPIDSATPEERISKILEQLEPTLIISDKDIRGFKSITMDKLKSSKSTSKFNIQINPHNLAYIIFTSGTTGIPKGVCINRLGLSNLISDAQSFFSIDSTSKIYQFTNFCFDNSVLEIFAALGSGATCFIPGGYFTADKFCQQISDYGITHAMLFPGLVETFDDSELAKLKELKCWICGAEKLGENLFKKAMNLGINVIQNYGPTETTAYCLRKKLELIDDPQNLGAPVQNAIVTVRRPDGFEAMNGSKLELFIASVGLTRGYLGRKWEDQPFVTFGDGLRYYPSGDICQRLPSGEIRFIGRKDNQVKIRGFRIELDEIESCLLSFPTVLAVKVLLLNQKMEDIIAFYSSKIQIGTKQLKDFLKQKLPYYMIPRFFVYLENFPLTSNSKIDTKKLMEYETSPKGMMSSDGEEVTAEEKMKQIWQKILKLNPADFDLHDSFFYLGGNSLTAQKLINEIKNELKIEIKMEKFYRNPTLSSILTMTQISKEETIVPTSKALPDKIPLSYQQEQMLYLEQIDPESSYNLAFIQEFGKNLDIEKLKSAFFKLLEENSAFRTIFKESEDDLEIYQEVLPLDKCFIKISVEPFNNTDPEKASLKQFKQKKFDLFKEIPLRVKILETQECFVILLIIHHGFSDATTTMLMEKELTQIYQGKKRIANVNKISYQEYSIQQKSEVFQKEIQSLTSDYMEDYGSTYNLTPAKVESIFKTNNFTQICKSFQFRLTLSKSRFTPFTLITAAIAKAFLPMFPKESFLLLGCPFANRTIETSETFGNFLNNLLLPLTSKHLTAAFDDLQKELLNLAKYGKIPFQHLCKKLRHKPSSINSVDIQIYLNCRYDLENESELNFNEINQNKASDLHEIFGEVTNYPIEIDLDELQSTTKTSDKNFEITVRISKTFFEADEKKVEELCQKFKFETEKIFHSKTANSINEKMLVIFNKFLQADLTKADLHKSFIDLGGDSILAMKLRRAIMKETGHEMDLRILMTAKSLSEILNPNFEESSDNEIIEFHKYKDQPNPGYPGALIIFIYPLVGGCLIYSSLIKQLKTLHQSKIQCIAGFHPPSTLPKSMEELALIHKSQLLKFYDLQKFPKILFIGASFGAALGYQICQELKSFQSITLISIDGTLQTSPKSIPTFEIHEKQICDIISKFSADFEGDNFEVKNEIEKSWKLLQMAANYTPEPLLKPMKCMLLYTSGSEYLQKLWKKYTHEIETTLIEGNHETMLSEENCEKVAKIILYKL